MSLPSEKNVEKKILDASLWITLSSFFYFWSILFFSVIYAAILLNRETSYKKLFIPVVGFVALFTLAVCYNLLVADSFDWIVKWLLPIGLDFSSYNQMSVLLPVTILITLFIWLGIARFSSLSSLKKKDRPNVIIILFTLGVSFVAAFLSQEKTGAEVVFVFGPLAIIGANYLETKKDFWFKEVLLWLVVLLPLIVVFL